MVRITVSAFTSCEVKCFCCTSTGLPCNFHAQLVLIADEEHTCTERKSRKKNSPRAFAFRTISARTCSGTPLLPSRRAHGPSVRNRTMDTSALHSVPSGMSLSHNREGMSGALNTHGHIHSTPAVRTSTNVSRDPRSTNDRSATLLRSDSSPLGCYAFFCPCCFDCEVYKLAGESMWTCMCPGAKYALRSKIRTAFRIEVTDLARSFDCDSRSWQGDLMHDCCATTFCACCSSIQLKRELQYQGV